MEKLLTKNKARRQQRNERIKAEAVELYTNGGMKQAIYDHLAAKYNISVTTALRIASLL